MTQTHLATGVTSLFLNDQDITALQAGDFAGLTSLTELRMYDNQLSTLPADLFDGLTALTTLYVNGNQLTSLPDGLFDGLSALTTLYLYGNSVDPLPLTVSLEKVGADQVKAVAPSGAPFEMVLPLTVANGDISGGATTITIPAGSVESQPLTVSRTPGTSAAVTVNFGTLPGLPANHSGYALGKSADLPLEMFSLLTGGICDRTPQVQTAILAAVPGVSTCDEVTQAHLAAVTSLNLADKSISSLKVGDFDGLSALATLNLMNNNQLTSLPEGVFSGLSALTTLNLVRNQLSSLPDGIFDNLNALKELHLGRNQLSSLPAGIFDNLNTLTGLDLGSNSVNPLPLTVSLEKVGEGQFKATAPAGAPFDIVLPLRIVDGTITGGANSITIRTGRVESDVVTVTRTPGTTSTVTVDIGTLPGLPANHIGYALVKSADLPLEVISTPANTAPVFTDGTSTTRSIAENTASGVNIGTAIAATDAENDALTYTLGGTDAAAFSIDRTTGQLKTSAALDYETKSSYSVVVIVSDDSLTDTITVTINVTNIEEVEEGGEQPEELVLTVRFAALPTSHDGSAFTFELHFSEEIEISFANMRDDVFDVTGGVATRAQRLQAGSNLGWQITIEPDSNALVLIVLSPPTDCEAAGAVCTEDGQPLSNSLVAIVPGAEQPDEPSSGGGGLTLSTSTTSPLTEATLHESVVTLTLSSGAYESSRSRIRDAVTVSGIDGVTVRRLDVARVSDTVVTVELTFDGTDFDSDGTLTFIVGAGAIEDYDGSPFTAQIVVTATIESEEVGDSEDQQPEPEAPEDSNYRAAFESSTPAGYTEVTLSKTGSVWGVPTQFTNDSNVGRVAFMVLGKLKGCSFANAEAARPSKVYIKTQDLGSQSNYESETVCGTTTCSYSSWDGLRITHLRFFDESSTPNIKEAVYNAATGQIEIPGESIVQQPEQPEEPEQPEALGLTARFEGMPASHDGSEFTFELHFSEEIEISFATLRDDVFDVTGGTVTGARRLQAGSNLNWQITIEPASDAQVSIVLPPTTDCEADGAVCTADGRPLSNEIAAIVSGAEQPEEPGNEGGTLTLSTSIASPLTEATLHESVVTLTLSGGTYESSRSRIRDAVTVSGIDGVTVRRLDVDRVSDTVVTVELTFDGTDFDTDGTLTFTVGAGAIADYDGGALTAQIAVAAGTESVVASTPSPLSGATLHESVVTLTLSGAAYGRIFDIRDAVTVSGITGVTIGSFDIERVSDTVVTVELQFEGNVDTDGTLTFTVGAEAIANYNGSPLTAQIAVGAGGGDQQPDSPEQPEAGGLTARFAALPASHDGSEFTFELHFSEEIEISFATLRDDVFDVTGGTVTGARRLQAGSNLGWQITIEPDANAQVLIVLPPTTDCEADGAVCTEDGQPLSNSLVEIVPGAEQSDEPSEDPTITASTTAPLTEATLPESVVTLTLSSGAYESSRTTIRDAVTVSGIDGVTVRRIDVARVSDTVVTVELTFDGTNFDTDATLTFIIGADAIAEYDGSPLTAQIAVAASIESAATEDDGDQQPDSPEQPEEAVLLTARFASDMPAAHDGSEFTFEIHFSEEIEISFVNMRDDVLDVTGGTVKGARRLQAGSNLGWQITIEPESNAEVLIVLPPTTDCDAVGAVCTEDGRPLGNELTAIVPGLLTARFEDMPAAHDGSEFTFEIHFSEEIEISFVNMRDDVLDVTGGTVKGARRLQAGSNLGWQITIEPDSDAEVLIVLPPTDDCEAAGAICTEDGRPLSNELTATVPGPAAKPVVSPRTFGLDVNYPNPFNTQTQLVYTLPVASPVELAIYNVMGQRVRTLVQGVQAAGRYQIAWDGRSDSGSSLASGVYLSRLVSTQGVQVRRLLLLK